MAAIRPSTSPLPGRHYRDTPAPVAVDPAANDSSGSDSDGSCSSEVDSILTASDKGPSNNSSIDRLVKQMFKSHKTTLKELRGVTKSVSEIARSLTAQAEVHANMLQTVNNHTHELSICKSEIKDLKSNVSEHEETIRGFDTKLDGLRSDFTQKINELASTQGESENRMKTQDAYIQELRYDARELYEHKEATNEKFEGLDRVKRKPNLVLYGVPENYSNPKEVARDLFTKIEANISPAQLTDAYRLGPNPPHGATLSRPRPLMLSLQHASLKKGIFKNLSKLAGDPSWKKITVTDDLTPNDQLKKRTLKSVVMQARRQGLSAKLSGNGAFINNQK